MALYFGSCAPCYGNDDATYLRSSSVATAKQLPGVLRLTPAHREALENNPERYAALCDMDGTLCAAGAPIGPRAAEIVYGFNGLQRPLGVITAQAEEDLLRHGGGIFKLRVSEKSQRIVHNDEVLVDREARDTSTHRAQTIECLSALDIAYGINSKRGGFAVNMLAAPANYSTVETFMRTLVSPGYVVDATAGFIDFGDIALNKSIGLNDAIRMTQSE